MGLNLYLYVVFGETVGRKLREHGGVKLCTALKHIKNIIVYSERTQLHYFLLGKHVFPKIDTDFHEFD